MTQSAKVFIRRDEKTGDVILSRKPSSWDDFFALTKTMQIPNDFMLNRDDSPPQERDFFNDF
jgi:antitoxin VapB